MSETDILNLQKTRPKSKHSMEKLVEMDFFPEELVSDDIRLIKILL